MIYLHKILPWFVSPMALILTLFLIGIVFHRRVFLWTGLSVLLLLSNPLLANYFFSTLEHPLQPHVAESASKADAVVVLSGILTSVNTPKGIITEWDDPDRFFAGIELIKSQKAKTLIFTGGKVPWQPDAIPEGQILRQAAISMNIEKDMIQVTPEVQNTFQEAEAVAKMLPKGSSILLVTSAFHMNRAQFVFEQVGLKVIPFAVDFKAQKSGNPLTIMHFLPSADALDKFSQAIREYIGRIYYRLILG